MSHKPFSARPSWLFYLLVAIVWVLSACANASTSGGLIHSTQQSTDSGKIDSPLPTLNISSLFPTPTMVSVPTYTNPVYAGDFPDPFILRLGDVYYAYATNSKDVNVQLLRSTNLADWEYIGEALERLPDWSDGEVWAPAVLARGDQYVLYYTLNYRAEELQCISIAVSDKPEGPFRDTSSAPLLFQTALGGSIDASPFVDDDGTAYLLWKNNGNDYSVRVSIWIQTLSADGLELTGQPVELIYKDQLWEGPLIEGPSMIKHGDRYYLFYSANEYESAKYAVGYAVCDAVTGPCVKPQNRPFFSSAGSAAGPGGQEFFTDPQGTLWMAYHAWIASKIGYPSGARSLRIDRLTFRNDVPVLQDLQYDPVYPDDFPDPFILPFNDLYLAYGSPADSNSIQLLQSTDLATWELIGDVLPELPAWADGKATAPSVLRRGDQFMLYYAIRSNTDDCTCISLAKSNNPKGPFQDVTDSPFLCQKDLGGSANPSVYVEDNGKAFLLWNSIGNDQGITSIVWSQLLSEDGLALRGEPAALSTQDMPWEEPRIEKPSMIRGGDTYYLFYSANEWNSLSYSIGLAECTSVEGPCVKMQKHPFLGYFGKAMGPGGQEFFTDNTGKLWMVYHSWLFPNTCYPDGVRNMRIDLITFIDESPSSNGPTTAPEPLP